MINEKQIPKWPESLYCVAFDMRDSYPGLPENAEETVEWALGTLERAEAAVLKKLLRDNLEIDKIACMLGVTSLQVRQLAVSGILKLRLQGCADVLRTGIKHIEQIFDLV